MTKPEEGAGARKRAVANSTYYTKTTNQLQTNLCINRLYNYKNEPMAKPEDRAGARNGADANSIY